MSNKLLLVLATGIIAACEVPNDIPYPVVDGRFTAFEVEGQCNETDNGVGTSDIDKANRTIQLYVSDTVNLKQLRIKRIELKSESRNPDFTYRDKVTLLPDSSACVDYDNFPRVGFEKPMLGQDTRMDFSHDVNFTLRTYQDYMWKVSVKQIIERQVEVENQVGNAIIDPHTHTVVVYVNQQQNLRRLKVHKFSIGGKHGKVVPDPTTELESDFFNIREFDVTTGWGEQQRWRVMAFHTDQAVSTTAQVFARTIDAVLKGEKPNGSKVEISYREAGQSDWSSVASADITTTSTAYEATVKGLKPATTYEYIVRAGDSKTDTQTFTTTQMLELPNASFDQWCEDEKNPKLLFPWAKGDSPFWDTGNKGATTVGNSNSVPSDDSSTGLGKSAYLESKHIVVKFAAGNIFTGTYLRTDGTNGILGFGKPFCAFPTKLSFDYKFHTEAINKVGDESLRYLEGRPDSCQIYIALWHVEDNEYEEYNGEKFPIVVRTRPSERRLFSPSDPRVIAYAQLTQGQEVSEWTTHTLEIKYKGARRMPTHIQVVASSSKFGDYFTGGVGTLLQLDNMKLHYE